MVSRACSHYPQPISDEREVDQSDKHDVELFESREDASKALEPAEQPFDFVAPLVQGGVVLPRRNPVLLGGHHWDQVEVERQLPCLIAFVRPVHQQVQWPRSIAPPTQELAPLGRVVGLAGGQRKRYDRSSIRGNQMNLGGPSGAGLADDLRAVFFRAPGPSGCTFTAILSSATASILRRTI